MEMSEWEEHLRRALLLERERRLQAIRLHLDPRATRVSLKYALLVDNYVSKEHGLTEKEDKQLDEMAQQLFNDTPQVKETMKHDVSTPSKR